MRIPIQCHASVSCPFIGQNLDFSHYSAELVLSTPSRDTNTGPSGNMSHGQRTRRITPRGSLSNSTDLKKFTRKDLENACRRITPSQKDNGIKRQRGQFEFLPTHQVVGADSQLKSLDTGVKVCARKYNEWKAKADKLQEQLAQKRDILIELTREEDALDQMIQGNNGESKKISKLKSEISATNTASESNLHYRLQLNYLHLRQRKNDMAVDAHMSELAHTLSSSQNELTRRTKMLGDIESGTSTAMHAYELLATEVTIERNGREQEMAGKEVEVENAKKMEAWRSNQESNRKDFQQALIGGHEMEKDAKLIRIRELQGELKLLNKNSELKSNGEDSSEEAFLNIKRATGVNSLEDVVQKFTNRQVQKRRLISEKAEAEERLLSAKNKLQACHDKLSQLRSNGSGETEFSRSLLVDASKAIGEERSEGKILKSTNSRLDTVIVGLRQGGMGLYQRLLSFHTTLLEGDAPLLNNSFTSNAIDTANDTLEMLKVAQQILSKMLDAVGGIDVVCKGQITSKPNLRRESTSKIENPNLGENNCRIQAKSSSSLSSKGDPQEYDTTVDAKIDEHDIISRHSLKQKSVREAGDAMKIEERDRNKTKEKLQNEGGEEIDALKKTQQDSMTRMSQHHLPFGLPKSVNLRDDPLNKAQAFLTEMPAIE